MRVIIMADGKGTRWNNFGNCYKQMVEVDGEKLLHRTVRLLKEAGIEDIWITSHDPDYDVPGTTRYEPQNNEFEIDKFCACEEIWGDDVVFLWGDTYFTKEALQTILTKPVQSVPHGTAGKGFLFFGRYGGSDITGKVWGEIFGLHVTDIDLFLHDLEYVKDQYLRGIMGRCGTWALYRVMVAIPSISDDYGNLLLYGPSFHVLRGNFVEIDDSTEDFDLPEDYITWLEKRTV